VKNNNNKLLCGRSDRSEFEVTESDVGVRIGVDRTRAVVTCVKPLHHAVGCVTPKRHNEDHSLTHTGSHSSRHSVRIPLRKCGTKCIRQWRISLELMKIFRPWINDDMLKYKHYHHRIVDSLSILDVKALDLFQIPRIESVVSDKLGNDGKRFGGVQLVLWTTTVERFIT